jgi:hypothetical protein
MLFPMLSKPLPFLSLLVVILLTPSCEKDEPEEVVYFPVFTVSYQTSGPDLFFLLTCTSDDVEIIEVEVIAPGSAEPVMLKGPLMASANEPFSFTDPFQRTSGNWTFHIHGRVRSGEHIGITFMVSKSIEVVA